MNYGYQRYGCYAENVDGEGKNVGYKGTATKQECKEYANDLKAVGFTWQKESPWTCFAKSTIKLVHNNSSKWVGLIPCP